MAATRAVLSYLEEKGPTLQESLNTTTRQFVNRLEEQFRCDGISSVEVSQIGSMFRLRNQWGHGVLLSHLLEKGVGASPHDLFFFSTAHRQADLDILFNAVVESARELRQVGL